MNRGAFDFLTKPIDFGDFETTIRKTLAHIGALREARERQAAAERAQASLARYFSPNLARSLAMDATALAGGQRREIATLFTDIASFTALVETSRHDDPVDAARRIFDRHDRNRVRARRNRGQDHRRCHPCAVRRAGRPARRRSPSDRLRARSGRLGGSVPPRLECARRSARRDAHRRSRGAGDRRQFRRRPVVRLHRLWRHGQRRGAARGGQQDARHAHLRKRRRGRARRRVFWPAGRRSHAARPQRAVTRLRAAARKAPARSTPMHRPSPSWRRRTPPPSPPSPRSSARDPTMRWRSIISSGC